MHRNKKLLLELINDREYVIQRRVSMYVRYNREQEIPEEYTNQMKELKELKSKVEDLANV